MAHPFAKHNEEDAGRSRAKAFTKKTGGAVAKHADGGTVLKRASGGKVDSEVPGKATGGRLDKFARGGRTKGHNTKINIVVAPRGPHPTDGAAPPAGIGSPALLGGGPPPPMGGPPMGGPPPGMAPPGGPPGPRPPGMMKRGGAVKKFATGGGIKMKGGADTGQGRLDKAKAYKARG